jgi:cytidylate kinase
MTVIAMTREIGSRGTDVAAGVAAQLGLEIINSEIVVPDVAGSLGVEQGVVQRYLDGKASLFERWQVDKRKLSRYTLNQVLTLSMKDNVLIRGWGAAALFQGIRGILCVRVCAPMAERVRVMMERLAMKDAEATWQEIERFDAANSRAMRASFNFDWNDALLYHVVLNSARVPVDACVRAVCELAKEQRFQDDTATKLALPTNCWRRGFAQPLSNISAAVRWLPSPYRPPMARSSLKVRPATAGCPQGRQSWHARLKV